jgi:uncharacterized membrane-anchored protein YhcB (DUF1043 family)
MENEENDLLQVKIAKIRSTLKIRVELKKEFDDLKKEIENHFDNTISRVKKIEKE